MEWRGRGCRIDSAKIEDHPLLWIYHEDKSECELTGDVENINDFIGALYLEAEKKTGNWLNFRFNTHKRKIFNVPRSLANILELVAERFELKFEVITIETGVYKGYANKPNAKVIKFGNEDVSPNRFNLRQPHVTDEEFQAIRIK
jgi:hypothetical protein